MFVTRHPQAVDTELIDGIRVASAAETMLEVARDLSVLDLAIAVASQWSRQSHAPVAACHMTKAQETADESTCSPGLWSGHLPSLSGWAWSSDHVQDDRRSFG
jgi:hypothetical protein